jgi:hypothetical protein
MYLGNYKHLLQQFAKKIVKKIICMKKLFLDKTTCSHFLK